MKKLSLFMVLVCLVAGNLQAATIGSWTSGATGVWSDGTKWATPAGAVPSTTVAAGDEIKITASSSSAIPPFGGSDVTADSTVNLNYACTVSVVGGNTLGTDRLGTASVLRVTTGANLGTGVLRFGNRTTSGNGAAGVGIQSGGTLSVTDLLLAQWGGSGASVAEGYYTISGGILQAKTGAAGRLWIGGNSSTVAGSSSANTVGKFTVVGDAANITMNKLYVGCGTAANGGMGTLEFQVASTGVSRIKLADATAGAVSLDLGGANSIANLIVSGTTMPAGDIVLVENLSATGGVTGVFDSLNGGSAAEGATTVIGGVTYKLTYAYAAGADAVANDIALVTPEPATIAVLGLGGLLLRRRLA